MQCSQQRRQPVPAGTLVGAFRQVYVYLVSDGFTRIPATWNNPVKSTEAQVNVSTGAVALLR